MDGIEAEEFIISIKGSLLSAQPVKPSWVLCTRAFMVISSVSLHIACKWRVQRLASRCDPVQDCTIETFCIISSRTGCTFLYLWGGMSQELIERYEIWDRCTPTLQCAIHFHQIVSLQAKLVVLESFDKELHTPFAHASLSNKPHETNVIAN